MAFWKRGKKGKKGKKRGKRRSREDGSGQSPTDANSDETANRRIGVVSSVPSPPEGTPTDSPFRDVVERRFGPSGPSQPDHLRAVEALFPDHPATPELEVAPMAHIGRTTTITGDIVAEENVEIQGTIEGSVRLTNHQLTVGNEGHVKASVDADVVVVYGKVTGDVVASDLVEVEKGGIVGGDIKASRIIMHDGAIVVGGLDMSASLPNSTGSLSTNKQLDEPPDHPHLQPVADLEHDASSNDEP